MLVVCTSGSPSRTDARARRARLSGALLARCDAKTRVPQALDAHVACRTLLILMVVAALSGVATRRRACGTPRWLTGSRRSRVRPSRPGPASEREDPVRLVSQRWRRRYAPAAST